MVSIVIAEYYSDAVIFENITGSPSALIILTIALSLLMVSRIPLFSLKIKSLNLKGNEGRYLLVLLILISLVILGPAAISLIIPIYIIASLFSLLF